MAARKRDKGLAMPLCIANAGEGARQRGGGAQGAVRCRPTADVQRTWLHGAWLHGESTPAAPGLPELKPERTPPRESDLTRPVRRRLSSAASVPARGAAPSKLWVTVSQAQRPRPHRERPVLTGSGLGHTRHTSLS